MQSSSGTRVGFALHKSRSYLKACVLSRRGSSSPASRRFPGGGNASTATLSGFQEQAHLRRSLETETRVNRLAKGRSVEEHHGDAARLCESNRFPHDASSVAAAAMGRLREHREKIRRGRPFPVRPRLDVHEPKATAGDGFPADVNDEAGEPIRLHLHPCPTTVDAVRRKSTVEIWRGQSGGGTCIGLLSVPCRRRRAVQWDDPRKDCDRHRG